MNTLVKLLIEEGINVPSLIGALEEVTEGYTDELRHFEQGWNNTPPVLISEARKQLQGMEESCFLLLCALKK